MKYFYNYRKITKKPKPAPIFSPSQPQFLCPPRVFFDLRSPSCPACADRLLPDKHSLLKQLDVELRLFGKLHSELRRELFLDVFKELSLILQGCIIGVITVRFRVFGQSALNVRRASRIERIVGSVPGGPAVKYSLSESSPGLTPDATAVGRSTLPLETYSSSASGASVRISLSSAMK